MAYDKNGNPYIKRAFNTQVLLILIKIFLNSILCTQVCEQLNAWLGGYQSILKCMTPGNFNWFLHAMLFYHTKYVIRKQMVKKQLEEEDDEEEDLGLDEDNDEDYGNEEDE